MDVKPLVENCKACGVMVGADYIINTGLPLCHSCYKAGILWAARMAAKQKEPVGGLPACDCDAESRKGSCLGVHRDSCAVIKELKSRQLQRRAASAQPTELKAGTPMVRNPDGKYRVAEEGEAADAFVAHDTVLAGDPEQRIEAVEAARRLREADPVKHKEALTDAIQQSLGVPEHPLGEASKEQDADNPFIKFAQKLEDQK